MYVYCIQFTTRKFSKILKILSVKEYISFKVIAI